MMVENISDGRKHFCFLNRPSSHWRLAVQVKFFFSNVPHALSVHMPTEPSETNAITSKRSNKE